MRCAENLKRDHDVILHVTFALGRACSQLMGPGDTSARVGEPRPAPGGEHGPGHEFFAQAVDFLEEFGNRYHGVKEETFIFPRLVCPGVDVGVDEAVLREQHEQARQRLRWLRKTLVGKQTERAEVGAGPELLREAFALVGLLQVHIEQENKNMLPALGVALSDEEDGELARQLHDFEATVLGPNAGDRYHQIAHELVHLSAHHHH